MYYTKIIFTATWLVMFSLLSTVLFVYVIMPM